VKWEELIAEAESAGVLAFCADGLAVLKREGASKEKPAKPAPGQDRSQGGQGGQGQSEGSDEGAS
jgi:hypothetical protein